MLDVLSTKSKIVIVTDLNLGALKGTHTEVLMHYIRWSFQLTLDQVVSNRAIVLNYYFVIYVFLKL